VIREIETGRWQQWDIANVTGEIETRRGQQWDLANVTGETEALRTNLVKLPKTANFFCASRINLHTLSMKTYPSLSESIKISWDRWGNQRLPKICKKNWTEERSLEI
jgi:hypothetical protein